jgi:PelD GGDEF domain
MTETSMDDDRQNTEQDARQHPTARRWHLRRRMLPDGDWGRDLLRREVDRSRRHAHPLALVRLAAPGPRGVERAYRDVGRLVRSIDAVWAEPGAVLVLLPEADRTSAEGFLARVRASASEYVALDRVKMACFPADALTADALCAAVDEKGFRSRVREPRGATAPTASAATAGDGSAVLGQVE